MTVVFDVMEYTCDPKGVLHLIDPHPDVFDTFCGTSIRTKPGKPGWTIVDETLSGSAVECFTCRLVLRRRRSGADEWGNTEAQEGIDVCPCGCKYWENDQCHDCGANWHPSYREGYDD